MQTKIHLGWVYPHLRRNPEQEGIRKCVVLWMMLHDLVPMVEVESKLGKL